jgi:hypothetical protein
VGSRRLEAPMTAYGIDEVDSRAPARCAVESMVTVTTAIEARAGAAGRASGVFERGTKGGIGLDPGRRFEL